VEAPPIDRRRKPWHPELHPALYLFVLLAAWIAWPHPGVGESSAYAGSTPLAGCRWIRTLSITVVQAPDGPRFVDRLEEGPYKDAVARSDVSFGVLPKTRRGVFAMTEETRGIMIIPDDALKDDPPAAARGLARALHASGEPVPDWVIPMLASGRWEETVPLSGGYVHDAVCGVLVLASVLGLFPTVGWIGEALRERHRNRCLERRVCPRCGYDLRSLGADSLVAVCPECGTESV
jgi:hypothetical protein